MLLGDDNGELEALLLGIRVSGDADVGEDTEPSTTTLRGEMVIIAEARASSTT